MLNQNSTIPLYEQVKEAIKLKIEQKEWKENTRVPSETELMKIYEVSRVTVRNAPAQLWVKLARWKMIFLILGLETKVPIPCFFSRYPSSTRSG